MPSLGLASLAAIGAITLVAFIVRGIAGFGASMIAIGGMTLWLPPAQVVPVVLAIELLTATHLLPGVWRQVDWRALRSIVLGCAVFTPLGVMLLGAVPADAMRAVVSGCLFAIALLMLMPQAPSWAARVPQGPRSAFMVGSLSGLLNGAAGIGGPPAVVFFFTTRAAAISRASLIAYFVFTDLTSLAWAGAAGLLQSSAWSLLLAALPFSLLGVFIGSRIYLQLDEAALRRWVWRILAILGAIGLAMVGWRLTQ
jgi:uncharacterized protein